MRKKSSNLWSTANWIFASWWFESASGISRLHSNFGSQRSVEKTTWLRLWQLKMKNVERWIFSKKIPTRKPDDRLRWWWQLFNDLWQNDKANALFIAYVQSPHEFDTFMWIYCRIFLYWKLIFRVNISRGINIWCHCCETIRLYRNLIVFPRRNLLDKKIYLWRCWNHCGFAWKHN